jgi:hypothetical protein
VTAADHDLHPHVQREPDPLVSIHAAPRRDRSRLSGAVGSINYPSLFLSSSAIAIDHDDVGVDRRDAVHGVFIHVAILIDSRRSLATRSGSRTGLTSARAES